MSSPSPTPPSDSKEFEEKYQSPTTEQEQMEMEKGKEKETVVDNEIHSPSTLQTTVTSTTFSAGTWQAVFSPQHNSYYFYNTSTGETTWANPLQPSSSDPSSSVGSQDQGVDTDGPDDTANPNPYDPNSLEARAIAAGIDPSLAYLDPSLAGPSSVAPAGTFAAKFNARTGTFTAVDGRAPSHLSEYERMKRMNAFYFDVGAWEQEVEQRDAEEKAGGKKRKRPTKKDLERFKEQKKLKKIAKTAWLRT